jgi:hypothetical protein
MAENNVPQFCPTCSRFIPDHKTRLLVAKFASEGIDVSHLAESVTFEPMQEQEPRIILISTISGPVKIALAFCVPIMLGSAVAFQYGTISGPLASLAIVGSFSAFVLMLGGNPSVLRGTAIPIEIQPSQVAEAPADFEPDMDEVTRPYPNSMSIRFYEPPIRPSGVPVSWESICYACRRTLAGRPFSEREISGPKGAKISGPDFRILAGDFLRRGYTERSPDGVTGFTPRGAIQVKKLAQLPY